MRVYLVRRESGCYSDHLSVIEAVFSTRELAVSFIESHEDRYVEHADGTREDFFGPEDLEEGDKVVSLAPTCHPSMLGRDAGDPTKCSWYVDNVAYGGDDETWFVDEFEVDSEVR